MNDDETNLTLFKAIFENDYQVLITSDTAEARQMMSDNEIKVAIVDLFMPQESGTDFIADVSKLTRIFLYHPYLPLRPRHCIKRNKQGKYISIPFEAMGH